MMNSIQVLDCTLRDGGYCNEWKFGKKGTSKIIEGLTNSGIDIIECGFITNRVDNDPDVTKFRTLDAISPIVPSNRRSCIYVGMINYGEYDPKELPLCNESPIDGLRIAFHKKDLKSALEMCRQVKDKGYKVFVQAMVSMAYTDLEFISMIDMINDIEPYAFYIVDSFGMMKRKDMVRFFSLVEHNLKDTICIGFHSHNNMQLAYSNAQTLVEMQSDRNLIIDSSIYGMGRGAGNLNTELFIEYLNDNYNSNYLIKPILEVMDEVINDFYRKRPWGYSLPNYLSAKHNTHPNYAGYLSEKNTLTAGGMNEIFEMMDEDKKVEFSKEYAESMYIWYMERGKSNETHLAEFANSIKGKEVLLIGPAKSSEIHRDKIMNYVENNDVVTISVNFSYPYVKMDYLFISNMRRYNEVGKRDLDRCVVTSNVPADGVFLKVKYQDLLNEKEVVRDNAGLMAVNLMIKMGAKRLIMAGFDGYSYDSSENFAEAQMVVFEEKAKLDAINHGMGTVLSEYSNLIEIVFLTEHPYYNLISH